MKTIYYALIIFALSLSAGVMLLIHSGCRLTTTTTYEPIQREELSPYLEQQVKEYNDSCRLVSRDGGVNGEEDTYCIKCKSGANKVRSLITKK